MTKYGDFHGLNTRVLANDHLCLEVLADAGPRIVRLSFAGSDRNLLAEVPDMSWETPYGTYYLRGGHRLWHAPEVAVRSYVPDNEEVRIEQCENGLRLCQPTEEPTGIRKSIEIHLHADRPAVTLHHHLQNDGTWPIELSPWAITQLPLGGVAVLPQYTGRLDPDGLQPNRHLVFWCYTRWEDPRLHLHDDYLLVDGQPDESACKVGYLNRRGWLGYLRNEVFFCKRFAAHPDRQYPDFGCNAEVYVYRRFLELETLAPMCRLAPGERTTHTEVWELYDGVTAASDLAGVQDLVERLDLHGRDESL